MSNSYEKYPVESGNNGEIGSQDKIDLENEQIQQLLTNERKTNPEYQECLEKLKSEFDRRVAKVNELVQQLSRKVGKLDWFIIPPVMSRTDYGYSSDMDLAIIYDEAVPPVSDFLPSEGGDDIFIMPRFIRRETLDRMGNKYPEVADWYAEKITKEKPAGKADNPPIDALALEDQLRYSVSEEKREKIRNFRIALANYFIKTAKKRINILSWSTSGSTVEDTSKFSECSDLDLDILVDSKTPDEETDIYFYLHDYLKDKFAEDYQVKLCFVETSLDFVKKSAKFNPDMKIFLEEKFQIKL